MSRYDRTPSTVTVTPLDLSEVFVAAAEWLTKHREIDGKSAVTKVDAGLRWGIVDTPVGLYALNSEGVGPDHPVTDEKPLTVELFVRGYADQGEGEFISIFPSCTQALQPAELRRFATGEPVALHEFVRTFGARLEANYSSWKRVLEAADAQLEKVGHKAPDGEAPIEEFLTHDERVQEAGYEPGDPKGQSIP